MIKKKLRSKRAEIYVDFGVKILISVVIGALLLSGLYGLFNTTVMPTVKNKVEEMFNYSGGSAGGGTGNKIYTFDEMPLVSDNDVDSAVFTCSGITDVSKFKQVLIDGNVLEPEEFYVLCDPYFTLGLESDTIVYMNCGMHSIEVIFDDGYAIGEFEEKWNTQIRIVNRFVNVFYNDSFNDWFSYTSTDGLTNGYVWRISGDDKIYTNATHTRYLVEATWDSVFITGHQYLDTPV